MWGLLRRTRRVQLKIRNDKGGRLQRKRRKRTDALLIIEGCCRSRLFGPSGSAENHPCHRRCCGHDKFVESVSTTSQNLDIKYGGYDARRREIAVGRATERAVAAARVTERVIPAGEEICRKAQCRRSIRPIKATRAKIGTTHCWRTAGGSPNRRGGQSAGRASCTSPRASGGWF